MSDQHPVAYAALEVNGIPLPSAYVQLIKQIQLTESFDGADQLTVEMKAWDEDRGQFRVVGENVMGPGSSIVLKTGYGANLRDRGRFDLNRFEPSFGAAEPSVSLVGYSGLSRLMKNEQPWDFGRPKTYSDAVRMLGARYNMAVEADPSGDIPYKVKQLKRRKRKRNGTRAQFSQRQKLIKRAGVNDLTWLKWMASSANFYWPRVVYKNGRDTLLFQAPSSARQRVQTDRRIWRYVTPGEDAQQTLLSFNPTLNLSNLPRAVRVTGNANDGKVHVVEAEIVGQDILRSGESAIRISLRDSRPITKQERQLFTRPGALVLDVLGAQSATTEYNPIKKRKEQMLGREVVKSAVLINNIGDLEAIARGWLRARLQLFCTGDAEFDNVVDSDLITPHQAHKVDGVSNEYLGWWMVKSVTHVWAPAAGHKASARVQKLQSVPANMKAVSLEKQLTSADLDALAAIKNPDLVAP